MHEAGFLLFFKNMSILCTYISLKDSGWVNWNKTLIYCFLFEYLMLYHLSFKISNFSIPTHFIVLLRYFTNILLARWYIARFNFWYHPTLIVTFLLVSWLMNISYLNILMVWIVLYCLHNFLYKMRNFILYLKDLGGIITPITLTIKPIMGLLFNLWIILII